MAGFIGGIWEDNTEQMRVDSERNYEGLEVGERWYVEGRWDQESKLVRSYEASYIKGAANNSGSDGETEVVRWWWWWLRVRRGEGWRSVEGNVEASIVWMLDRDESEEIWTDSTTFKTA